MSGAADIRAPEPRLHPGINLGAAHRRAHEGSEAPVFGFWVFLMSDFITFGILFASYAALRGATAGGPGPDDLFNLTSVAFQTAFLLASSLTYGLASLGLKHGRTRAPLAFWLSLTAVLGAAFLGLEIRDFIDMGARGGLPTRSAWLSAYYALVGLHGAHIAIGLVWIAVMAAQLAILGPSDRVKTRFLLLGLYWHFLDLIWIGIFSIVFLAGVA